MSTLIQEGRLRHAYPIESVFGDVDSTHAYMFFRRIVIAGEALKAGDPVQMRDFIVQKDTANTAKPAGVAVTDCAEGESLCVEFRFYQ